MKNTEVELRGPLKPGDKERVEEFLNTAGATKVAYHDLGIFFNADGIGSFGTFATGNARLQANQKTHLDGRVEQVVKMKLGKPTGIEREEYEMSFNGSGLRNFLELVKRFGITQATFRGCERHDYEFGDFMITLKFGHAIGDHFELETKKGTESDLRTFLGTLDLTPWTEEQFRDTVLASRNKHPYRDFEGALDEFNIR